ncbi:glycosyltransferase [bacterium]|nr:glycosyltransferase [bacterium]
MNNKRIKILQILNHATLAGTEKHVLQLAQRLDRDVFDIFIACFEEGPLLEQFSDMGIKAHAFPKKSRIDIRATFSFYKFIKNNKFDIIHAHGSQLPGWLGRLANIPVIIETRHGLRLSDNTFKHMSPLTYWHQRLKVALSSTLLTVAETDRQILITQFGAKPTQVHNIYNGVDASVIAKEAYQRKLIRKQLGLTDQDWLVGTVARLTPQKGLNYFIDAMSILKKMNRCPHCIIIGDGPEKEPLMAQSHSLGLDAFIHFLGYQQDIPGYLHAMDSFILPSIWEGLPYAILEAMAAGKAVIASRIFGMEEIISHDKNGLLVPPCDAESLATAIFDISQNKQRAQMLGMNAQKSIQNKFSIDQMIHQISEFYRSQFEVQLG